MNISARNQISGRVASINPEAVNGSVKVDMGDGVNDGAIADLELGEGDQVAIRVKAMS